MKSKNKLEGALNFQAWKTRIDLILAKNKVLDIVKGNILKTQFEAGKEKEPHSVAAMEKFKRDMSMVQCFECHDYGHYKRNCPKLSKKRKEIHHAFAAKDEEPSKKAKHDETDFFYYSALTGTVEDDM
jgi:hypothetical protein